MDNPTATITALQAELEGLREDKALGHISIEEYHAGHQRISKAISREREKQPSNFNSPEPEPGHFADPFLQLRLKLIKEYNAAINQIRASGIYDEAGHRVKCTESNVRQIYNGALNQVSRARSLPVLKHIQAATADKVAKAMPNRYNKAA